MPETSGGDRITRVSSAEKPQRQDFCPCLHSHWDQELRYLFPTPDNACYRVQPAAGIPEDHQVHYCLSPRFIRCPIYQGNTEGEQAARGNRAQRAAFAKVAIVATLIVLPLLYFLWLSDGRQRGESPGASTGFAEATPNDLEPIAQRLEGRRLPRDGADLPAARVSLSQGGQ